MRGSWKRQVRKQGKIGLNQPLIYTYHFPPLSPNFCIFPPLPLSSQKKLPVGRKDVREAFATSLPPPPSKLRLRPSRRSVVTNWQHANHPKDILCGSVADDSQTGNVRVTFVQTLLHWKSSITHSECVRSPSYPACNPHAPYYFVICWLNGFTIFFHIIS